MNRLGLASLLWLLLLLPAEAAAQKYRYPISSGGTYVTAYFSHSGKDYTCAGYTYSGHTGNDYGVGSWAGMNAGKDVVAAAAGEVVYTQDGYFDRCTTGKCAGALGNYVQLKHADGKYTYYGHLKKWSIKVKKGDKVTCGQKLGQAGSSGYSTGPHLHFEVRSGSTAQDPYKGSCGGYGYWVGQGSYKGLPSSTCATVCGNGKCEAGETNQSCPKDCKPKLDAKYTGQGSDALKGSGGQYFSLCPGMGFKFWFSLRNTGSLTWEDKGKTGVAGQAVRLGSKVTDPFGVPTRVSVNKASDTQVKPGETTKFTMKGTAPKKTGKYKTEWQLVSEGYAWFGPTMFLTYNVTSKPPGSGVSCSTGKKGVCAKGTRQCSGGKLACAQATSPSKEKCDAKDNDCDGKTDEGLSRSCYSGPAGTAGKGLCKKGSQSCAKGKWGSCKGQVKPAAEKCDNKDNDCDGKTDEGLSRSCKVGLCKGVQSCKGGKWKACKAKGAPGPEICNDGKDNDCDGKTDEPDCVSPPDAGAVDLRPADAAGPDDGPLTDSSADEGAGEGTVEGDDTPDDGVEITSGCGCGAGGQGGKPPITLLVLLGLGLWARKRRG